METQREIHQVPRTPPPDAFVRVQVLQIWFWKRYEVQASGSHMDKPWLQRRIAIGFLRAGEVPLS